MHGNYKKLIYKLLCGMESKKEIEEIDDMIYQFNHFHFKFFCSLFTIVFIVLTIISFLLVTIRINQIVYFSVFLFLSSLSLLLQFVFKKDKKNIIVIILYYLLFIVAMVFGMVIGHTSLSPAVTYNVLLVALPIFICEKPYKTNVLMTILTIIFLYTSKKYKTPYNFHYDLVNCLSFLVLGICINTNTQISRMEDFTNRYVIKQQRDTDSLSGARTKRAFEVYTEKFLTHSNANGALVVLDIDNFKTINDTLGHSMGDYFIANTGNCLTSCCRSTDCVGRFGGDEFVILMEGLISNEDLKKKVEGMMNTMKIFFKHNLHYDKFSTSIGCTIFTNNSLSYKDLFDQADHALYIAKNNGKDRCVIFGEQG